MNLYKVTMYDGEDDDYNPYVNSGLIEEFIVAKNLKKAENIAEQLTEYYYENRLYPDASYEIEEVNVLGGYKIKVCNKVEDTPLEIIEKEKDEFEKYQNEPVVERESISFVISPMTTIEVIDNNTGKVVRSEEFSSENVSINLETKEVNIKGIVL